MEYIKGVQINNINKNSNIHFGLKKIMYFEIILKKIIEKITGNEDGLEANNKKIIKKSSK